MDQFQLNQTSKLPSKAYKVFAKIIEDKKDIIIEHFISKGNLMNIPDFWDRIRNDLSSKGIMDEGTNSYTTAAYLENVTIETESLIITFHRAAQSEDGGMFSTFELIVK